MTELRPELTNGGIFGTLPPGSTMLFALVILGIYMGWVEAVIAKPAESDEAPFPKPPEFYLRPELIPIKERDDTPKIADRYVRSRH